MAKPAIKLKKCAICKNEFQLFRSFAKTCSAKCALKLAVSNREKDERKAHKVAKEKLKSRSDWIKEVQTAFNRYVRARDFGAQCISCGKSKAELNIKSNIVMVCGHYLSVGAHPELRFNPLNANLQCTRCNGGAGKYGNFNNKQLTVTQDYRINLIVKIGIDSVEWLEGPHEPKKYTIDELKEIKTGFNQWSRELEKELE